MYTSIEHKLAIIYFWVSSIDIQCLSISTQDL